MQSDLSENESLVLKAISDGLSDPQSIAQKRQMKIETIRATADALAEQGLIEVQKSVEELFTLTDEGATYAREGLPERKLLISIGEGKSMSVLRDPALKIGLGWLRKKDWATIQAGTIKPLGTAELGEDEKVLQTLISGPKSSKDLDELARVALKSRGLVKSDTSKSWKYEITDKGQSMVKAKIGRAHV